MHVRVRTASDHNSAKSPSRQRASSSNSRVRSRVLGWVPGRDWIVSLNSKRLRCEIPRLKVTGSFNVKDMSVAEEVQTVTRGLELRGECPRERPV